MQDCARSLLRLAMSYEGTLEWHLDGIYKGMESVSGIT